MGAARLALAVLAGLPLWAAGTVFFDGVHWVLHGFLRSRWRVLRWIAWPHSVHHVWLDSSLRIRWENQRRNVWCHLVPEYLTQLAFSAALLLVLPAAAVVSCMALQTAVFALLLRQQGLDVNHRPIEVLDAYQPAWYCPPTYHALHHVWPDAHFSAYSKLVDWVVGGGLHLRGRSIALGGASTPLGRALRERLERESPGRVRVLERPSAPELAEVDLLVLCDPSADEAQWIEGLIRASRERQLPPEAWVVHERAEHGLARHYYRDVRVIYRTIVAPNAAALDARAAHRAARALLFLARRGLCFIPARPGLDALRAFRRFRATEPQRPAGTARVRHRAELRAA
jgi:hypothetical protein